MIKCNFCGKDANNHLTIKKNRRVILDEVHFCDKCESLIAESIKAARNRRLKDNYGNRALLIPTPYEMVLKDEPIK